LQFLLNWKECIVEYERKIEELTGKGASGMFGLEGVYGRVDRCREEVDEFIVLFGAARKWRAGGGERERLILTSLFADLSDYLGVFFYTVSQAWSTGGVTGDPRTNDLQYLFEFEGWRELRDR